MEHPRIALLRSQVLGLPLDEHYRAVLLESIGYFRDQIVARPRRAQAPSPSTDERPGVEAGDLG